MESTQQDDTQELIDHLRSLATYLSQTDMEGAQDAQYTASIAGSHLAGLAYRVDLLTSIVADYQHATGLDPAQALAKRKAMETLESNRRMADE